QRVGLSAFIQEGQGLAPVVGLTLPGEEHSNWVLPVNAQEAEPDLVRQLLALLASFLLGSVGGQVPRLPLRFGNVRNLCDVLPHGSALALRGLGLEVVFGDVERHAHGVYSLWHPSLWYEMATCET